ncbi:MAG TPA: DUF4383 domain-containing protein [Ktedonobacteraceae bacterium]|jgi:spore maturation protein SpmA|nr:DUF4383 domain-containing protein [Ktedonobacteraceae bacterium]
MDKVQRIFALVYGIVFLLIGILGFVPALVPGGALLGVFMVNGVHSIIHIVIGILGIASYFTGTSRLYNRVIGIVYLLIGILGFIPALAPGNMLLGVVMINLADNILHLVAGIVPIIVGFGIKSDDPKLAGRSQASSAS